MKTIDKLKPCPFCGGEAEWVPFYWYCGEMSGEYVRCAGCEMTGPKPRFVHQPDTVTMWNTRATLDEDKQKGEKLEMNDNDIEKLLEELEQVRRDLTDTINELAEVNSENIELRRQLSSIRYSIER